jgi:hypothetical protein
MLREGWTRLRFLMSPKPHREIDDELQFHIERQAQEYIAAGMTPQEARRKAVVALGGIESARAQSHEQRPMINYRPKKLIWTRMNSHSRSKRNRLKGTETSPTSVPD